MTAEANIFALLSPLVGGRVFPRVAPFFTPRPYVTYQRIGGDVITPLSGGIPDKQISFVQVNVWSDRALEAASLALQIEDAFRSANSIVAQPMAAPIDTHDEDVNLYGTQQDFRVVWTR